MKLRLVTVMAIGCLGLVAPASGQDVEKSGKRPAFEEVLAASKRAAGRQNGALMQAKVDVRNEVRLEGAGAAVLIRWKIDYTGPRFPFTIWKPGMTFMHYGGTSVELLAVTEDGKQHVVKIQADLPPPLIYVRDREGFATLKKGESATGTIEVGLGRNFNKVQLTLDDALTRITPQRLYVRLRHKVGERGERYNLDAWTGELQTELIPVPLDAFGKK